MTAKDFEKAFGASHRGIPFADRVAPQAKGAPVTVPTGTMPGAEPYKAYGFLPTNTVGETCDIRRWIDNTNIAEGVEFNFRYLVQVGYVADEQIRLLLPDTAIVIDGKHLSELRHKLARRQVTIVQQFSSRVWKTRPSAGETIVEAIQVLRANSL